MVTKAESSLCCGGDLIGGPHNLPFTVAIVTKGLMQEFLFLQQNA
jgi:hypothetical protein